jgi:hypothetical protein
MPGTDPAEPGRMMRTRCNMTWANGTPRIVCLQCGGICESPEKWPTLPHDGHGHDAEEMTLQEALDAGLAMKVD